MHLRSFSLRLLIALGVILNGSPLAMAYAPSSMHVTASVQAIEKNVSSDAMAEMPCHDMDAGELTSDLMDLHPSTRQDSATMPADCCESGACSCACAPAFAAMPMIAFVTASRSTDSIEVSAGGRHASPVLPHQSRPPIS